MKDAFSTPRTRPIAYLRHLVGSRRLGASGRSLRQQAENLGFTRSKGPQNVDQAFQAFLLRSK